MYTSQHVKFPCKEVSKANTIADQGGFCARLATQMGVKMSLI